MFARWFQKRTLLKIEHRLFLGQFLFFGEAAYLLKIWNGRQAIARKDKTGYYYYIYNGHGDVVALINEEGAVVNSYTYDPWGKQTVKKETVENPLGYGGEYQDRETELIYLRARYYSPEMRRFVREDPARDQWEWSSYPGIKKMSVY